MCREEVRLNRRLAPDIYLGVLGVVPTDAGVEHSSADDPRAIDYVVEMRRYDEHDTLAAMLERGELERSQMDEVARTLARFHARFPPADTAERGSQQIERRVGRNAGELLELVEQPAERERIQAMARFVAAFTGARG